MIRSLFKGIEGRVLEGKRLEGVSPTKRTFSGYTPNPNEQRIFAIMLPPATDKPLMDIPGYNLLVPKTGTVVASNPEDAICTFVRGKKGWGRRYSFVLDALRKRLEGIGRYAVQFPRVCLSDGSNVPESLYTLAVEVALAQNIAQSRRCEDYELFRNLAYSFIMGREKGVRARNERAPVIDISQSI